MKQSQLPFPEVQDKRPLTDNETKVLVLLCNGARVKTIANEMKMVRQTVTTHYVRSIRKKLGAKSTNQACAIYASQHPEILERK